MAKTKFHSYNNTAANRNRIFRFTISSTDYNLMEHCANSLVGTLKRSNTGSGFNLFTGERDYSYSCRGAARANAIIRHFRIAHSRRRRSGFEVFDHAAYDC